MSEIRTKSIRIGGEDLVIETGRMARLTNGSVTVRYGETIVLCTATASPKADHSKGWFPLFVEYREAMYSAGKIPGGFFRREGRPGEKEVLSARLIDRPCRPMFPGWLHARDSTLLQRDLPTTVPTIPTCSASSGAAQPCP